jgi:hypothetical protein
MNNIERVAAHIAALAAGETWPLDRTCVFMGGEKRFDYADLLPEEQVFSARVSRCYEIAAKGAGNDALVSEDSHPGVPPPEMLIHGRWSSPVTRDRPIPHAWVLLADGRIWEPITALICDPVLFARFTQALSKSIYPQQQVPLNMLRAGHYGPWV